MKIADENFVVCFVEVKELIFFCLQLEEGSIIFVYTLEYDPISTVEADTSDLASLAATIQSEVNRGYLLF